MDNTPPILVAEDNQMNLELVCYMLEALGYEYRVAMDGEEAVALCKQDSFSLVLMDCHMPKMDGIQATKEIRQFEDEESRQCRIPIIALTANAITGDKEKCLEMGMDDYLSKPFKFEQLKSIIEKWIDIDSPLSLMPTGGLAQPSNDLDNTEVVTVDFQHIEKIVKDPAVVKKLIESYLTQAYVLMDDIRCAVDQGMDIKFRKAAHTLKSSSANLGIYKMTEICEELENLPEGDSPLALASHLESVFKAATVILNQYGEGD